MMYKIKVLASVSRQSKYYEHLYSDGTTLRRTYLFPYTEIGARHTLIGLPSVGHSLFINEFIIIFTFSLFASILGFIEVASLKVWMLFLFNQFFFWVIGTRGFSEIIVLLKGKSYSSVVSSIYRTTNGGGESREGYLVTIEDGSGFDLADFPPGAFVVGDKVNISSLANPAGFGIVKGRSILKLCVLSATFVWSFMLLLDEVKSLKIS